MTESTDLASPDEPHERQAVANFKESPNPVAFEASSIIDAYLRACAEGRDWREACAEVEAEADDHNGRRVLTQKGLKAKGISYSRQHLNKKVRDGDFPRPFQVPSTPKPKKTEQADAAASAIAT